MQQQGVQIGCAISSSSHCSSSWPGAELQQITALV